MWLYLARHDIGRRYRRTALGPFWLTFSILILISFLSLLYANLFKLPLREYVPHLAVGYIVWNLISSVVSEGCQVFIGNAKTIKQVRLPLSVHVFRMVCRNLMILAHHSVIYLGVVLLFGLWPGLPFLFFPAGLALLVLTGVWTGLLLGLACARFRDLPEIVASVMRLAFFVTPVIWKAEQLSGRAALVGLNPLYYFLEALRRPLLGQTLTPAQWAVLAGLTAGGWIITLYLLGRFRNRVAYWL